jgi:hypothetical protein
MTSIGIGEESILYEAKYVDFTQIERNTDFIAPNPRNRNKLK